MLNFPINEEVVIAFIGVFFRLLGVLILLPMFGERQVPALLKIAFSLILSFIIFPMIKVPVDQINIEVDALIGLVLKESAIGMVLGFVSRIVFYGVLLAAKFVGYQMGFGMANMLDPSSGAQISPLAQFQQVIALAIFLVFNFHHSFIQILKNSFSIVPIGKVYFSPEIGRQLIIYTGKIFLIGVKLAAPILTALVFTMFSLGLIARTVPQVNVFVLSFPISFLIGFIVFIVSLSFFTSELEGYFNMFTGNFTSMLHLMASR